MHRFLVFFKNLRFKKKLFLSYLAVIIIPIMVLGFYSYNQARNFLMQQARSGLNDVVKKIADNIDYKFKRYNNIIDSIAFNSRVIQIYNNNYDSYFSLYNDLKETVDPLFSTIMLTNNDIKYIRIYTSNSTIANQANSILSMEHIRDKSWYKETTGSVQSGWYGSRESIFGVKRLPKQEKNSTDNLVYVEPYYDKLFDMIGNEKSDNYGFIVCDRKQNIIFSKRKFTLNDLKVNDKEIINHNRDNIRIGMVNCILIKRVITEPSWTIFYYVPVNSIAIDARSIIGATVVVVCVCLIILILVIWIFSATFVKRIDNLNKKIKIAAKGNLKIDIHSDSNDEIGELANGFGDMLASLNLMIEEVYYSKIRQKEAELRALQAQINPHFLYNTLSLINWKAIRIRAAEISSITATISKYYRTTLNKGRSTISIKDEIENIRAYIDIQLVMHDNGFDVFFDIDDEIYEYDMINLILQPIVENAIEHGIDRKEDGRGVLYIKSCCTEEGIEFCIEDNGPGMDEDVLRQVLTEQTRGYGMKNVQERIVLFFGESYGISINSDPGGGTSVKVNLPKFKEQCS